MVATFDRQALAALRAEPLSTLHKGLPVDAGGASAAALAAAGRRLLDGGFAGPLLAMDRAALRENIAAMAGWCRRHGVELAPHGKPTMAPAVFADQIAAGAWGMTVATVSQARVCRAFGISPVVIANQVVDAAGLAWIGRQLRDTPDWRVLCWVDSVAGVELADRALGDIGPARLDVLVEYGVTGGRSGCRTVPEALAVAHAVRGSRRLRLVGVAGYEGILGPGTGPEVVARVDAYLAQMNDLAGQLSRAGLLDHLDEVLLTAGGSSYFDRVAGILAAAPVPARVILRSGCYVTHDDGLYAESTPAVRTPDAPRLRPALRAWAQVSSRPEPGLLLVTMGRRDVSYDERLPVPLLVRRRHETRVRPFRATVTALNDQHGYLRGTGADIGDWVGFGISHPCTALERWRVIPVVEDGTVVDLVHTFF